MKFNQGILLFASLIFSSAIFAQEALNYQHRILQRTLKKAGITDMSNLESFETSDSLYSKNHVMGKYFRITDDRNSHYKYLYVGRVNSCRSGSCSGSNDAFSDYSSEYFDYFILFDGDKVVQEVRVFNYQATHGYEITARGWLKQFRGHKNQQLHVGKNIDAISGATISVHAITQDIGLKTSILSEYH